jgi:hypothetical protein
LFQYGFKEQRVTRKTGCRLGEICVEFKLARIRPALRFLIQPPVLQLVPKGGTRGHGTYLNELCKRRIGTLLLLELVLAIQLMRTVRYKGGEVRYDIKEDVSDALDDGVRLLALVERVAQAGVNCDDVVDIPKYLLDKVGAACLG